MTEREALKLALEALKTLHDENMDYLTRNKLGGENNQCLVFAREAITAIKEALAQPEQPKVRTGNCLRVGVCASEGHKIQLQRKPLTDEEIRYALESGFLGSDEKRNWQDDLRVARAIEAAHGIKGKA